MRVLVVCKANFEPSEDSFQKNRAYVYDHVQGLKEKGIDVQVFFLKGRGVISYLFGANELRNFLKKNKYDIVHGHYGFTGFVVGLVSPYNNVVTYHGSDIYEKLGNIISYFSIKWADWNIFVSKKLFNLTLMKPKSNFSIFPCGVNLDVFSPINRREACESLGLDWSKKRIIFSSAFSNPVKNFPLAKKAIQMSKFHDVELIELKNKTREEVSLLLNASDLLLITSHYEGSSQIAKEALACNCPIVSTNVGDIKRFIGDSSNSFICDFDPREISICIDKVLNLGIRSDGRQFILKLDNKLIVDKNLSVYKQIINKTK